MSERAATSLAEAPIRADLKAAYLATVAELAEAGPWLSSDERVAVAGVVRAALAEPDRPPWYRPSADGRGVSSLPDPAVDAAWRITNHPGTLTRNWHAEVVAGLPSPEYYIELAALVSMLNAVDRFAALLDLEVLPIPSPAGGVPLRRPSGGVVLSHWVPVDPDSPLPNVIKSLSTLPSILDMRNRLTEAQYMSGQDRDENPNFSRGTLDRRQMELLAVSTSYQLECFY